MFAPTSIAIAVISGVTAGLIFYVVARMLGRGHAAPVPPTDDQAVLSQAINDRYRAAADVATARLIKALERTD